jgi:hypothetical protein
MGPRAPVPSRRSMTLEVIARAGFRPVEARRCTRTIIDGALTFSTLAVTVAEGLAAPRPSRARRVRATTCGFFDPHP